MWLASVLFLAAGTLRSSAARVGVRAAEHSDFNAEVTHREAEKLLKYRTFTETGIRLLMAGEDLPLVAPSSLKEEDRV